MDREQDIPFVYENGVMKPEGAHDMPEGWRGIAHIRDIDPDWTPEKGRKAKEEMHRIARSGAVNSGGIKFTRDQMHERS